ncbi:MAG: hypothetical protein A2527_13595 [Candidatus Lambdaproteobacteria bacterium RIFOXYD2_FULL_50_16]|uniref:Cytochrome c-552/4 domain-containing protein n=1 Tax=Candidatus Lambdaproteobacteria bacterium RIFOXYD2_FULL_50_16 TaxID=1817772 RepID=A0A1F6G594_9PROT|nr:MAG: hypothetical protein A2527_13595 [Candidatus Lambdaproteobacteria bacterium RIFOXYD2_FULL_50_16]
MKNILFLLVFSFYLGGEACASAPKYLGTRACEKCHMGEPRPVMDQWLKGPHSVAFKRLLEPASRKLAASLEINSPEKSPKCLVCHATGFLREDRPEVTEGVGCEACHDPGQRYANFKTMARLGGLRLRKPKESAVFAKKVGLKYPTGEDCMRCHGPQIEVDQVTYLNPHNQPFDLKAAMVTIRHWR